MTLLLEMEQAEVVAMSDATQALEIAKRQVFDVVVSDVSMPGMDGHEVARRLVLLRRQAVYMVAVTGRDSEADMVRSVTAGFIEHVVKPCTMKQLSQVLRRGVDNLQRRRRPIESHQ